MRFSLVHPSRGRVERAEEAVREWRAAVSGAHECEHVLTVDADDAALSGYQALAERYGLRLIVGPNRTMVEATNRGAAAAAGDVLIVVSDDFGCPRNWDAGLAAVLLGREEAAVLVDDGAGARMMTLPVLTRAYYRRLGYIYHPSYLSMFADDDVTEVARADGVLLRATHLTFPHRHYLVGLSAADATYQRQNSNRAWWHGWRVFQKRRLEGFDRRQRSWRIWVAQRRVDAYYGVRTGYARLHRRVLGGLLPSQRIPGHATVLRVLGRIVPAHGAEE